MQVQLVECDVFYRVIEAASLEDALEVARDNVDRDSYPDCEGTLYLDVLVFDVEDVDNSLSDTVVLS